MALLILLIITHGLDIDDLRSIFAIVSLFAIVALLLLKASPRYHRQVLSPLRQAMA